MKDAGVPTLKPKPVAGEANDIGLTGEDIAPELGPWQDLWFRVYLGEWYRNIYRAV